MEKVKIYPYLIDKSRLSGYYEILFDEGYDLKRFEKKTNKAIYDWFLPSIKDYLFWTFNLTFDSNKNEEFTKIQKDLKAAICGEYDCNIFKKDEDIVICFKQGICFAITDKKENIIKLKKYQQKDLMKIINLRDEDSYNIPKESVKEGKKIEDSPELYAYILQLFKMIYLNKIHKDIQKQSKFDRTRNDFVEFTEKVYNLDITDKNKGSDLCTRWSKELKLDDLYLKIDNEFDLLYKNNKLNYNKNLTICSVVLFIIAIIIGIVNFINII